MVVRVRRASEQDADGIARVHTLGWQQGYAGLLPSDYLAQRTVDPALWCARLTEPWERSATFVAEVDGETVGFAGVGPPLESADLDHSDVETTDLGQLYTLYVLADHLGEGVGYQLHGAAVQELQTAGFSRAVLWVLATNARAIEFYRRQGWRAVERWREELLGDFPAREQRFEHDLWSGC